MPRSFWPPKAPFFYLSELGISHFWLSKMIKNSKNYEKIQLKLLLKILLLLTTFSCSSASSGAALTDTTSFSGTVPFTCSLLNGEQSVEMGYSPLGIMKPGFALLSGSSSVITASANGLARVSVQLENIASASPDAMQLHVRAPQMRNQSVANPNEGNNHTDTFDLEASLQLQLELLATVVDQPDEYEIEAVITCFQP